MLNLDPIMKILFGYSVLLVILACTQADQSNNPKIQPSEKIQACEKSADWGDTKICLPELAGMIECYSHPNIKAKTSRTASKDNFVLAYYLSNETYQEIDRIEEFNIDDYIKIFALTYLKNSKSDQAQLNKLSNVISNSALQVKWAEIKQGIEKKHDGLVFGKPVIIDQYSPDKNARTFIMIVKMKVFDSDEYISIITSNIVLVNERIISVAYCKSYEGEHSIIKSKSKNDYIISSLLAANK